MCETISSQKVFGIGLNKTGTTTLGQCGKILGLRCTSYDYSLLKDFTYKKDFSRIKQKVFQYDLFEDWPWPLMYKELDKMFPGSKFILTIRKSEEAWLNSLKNHSMRTHPFKHCRKLAYGFNYPHKNERHHIEFYRKHNNNVRMYFENRDNDFLEICWENGDNFEHLCKFLNKEVPAASLPHANKGKEKKVYNSWLLVNKLLSSMKY